MVARAAAKVAVREGVSRANPFASFGIMVGVGAAGDALSAMGFGVEGRYRPCCSDPSDGEVFEPRGVFYAPCSEEQSNAQGAIHTAPVHRYSVPVR